MSDWRFTPAVLREARAIGIGGRVAIHWCEAECPDQKGTVVGINIARFGKVEYTVVIDGDESPTSDFVHDPHGRKCGSIRSLTGEET